MPSRGATVAVYGATGRAGQRVALQLAATGARVLVAGHDPERIANLGGALGFGAIVASCSDPDALRRLAASADVVVNCAGPFAQTATPVAKACIQSGTHYLDISGERTALEDLLALDGPARRAGVVLCASAGAKGALGCWAASLLDEGRTHTRSSFEVAYAHAGEAYWRPSVGALLSVVGEGLNWEAARPLDHGVPPRAFAFPPPFGRGLAVHVSGTEDVAIERACPGSRVRSYLSVDPGTGSNVVWGLTHHRAFAALTRPGAPVVWRALQRIASNPQLASRLPAPGTGSLAVVVESSHDGSTDQIAVSTEDGYAASAAIVQLCTDRLMRPSPHRVGVSSVDKLVPAHDALRSLAKAGVVHVFKDGRNR